MQEKKKKRKLLQEELVIVKRKRMELETIVTSQFLEGRIKYRQLFSQACDIRRSTAESNIIKARMNNFYFRFH